MYDPDLSPEAMPDPVLRHAHLLMRINEAQERLDALRLMRARTAQELVERYGATKAARLLGISRVSLYRIVGQVPEVQQARAASRSASAAAISSILAESAARAAELERIEKEGGKTPR